jgi:hypothetical protein
LRSKVIYTCVLFALLCLATSVCASTNVALASNGCVAVADSVYSGDIPGKAIDGKWLAPGEFSGDNRWHAALEKPHPHWLWLKFRQPAIISRVVIHRADIVGYPVDFVGEYSTDGGFTFRQLFAVKGNKMTTDEFTIERSFSPITTDNFRLRILRSSNTQNPNYTQISEIEVFGDFVEPTPNAPSPIPPGILPEGPVAHPQSRMPHEWGRLLQRTQSRLPTISEHLDRIEFRSNWLRVVLSSPEPCITELCWDSLGKGKVDGNLLKPGRDGGVALTPMQVFVAPFRGGISTNAEVDGNVVRYTSTLPNGAQTHWEVRVSEKSIRMAVGTFVPSPMAALGPVAVKFAFDVSKTPVAPLANPRPGATAPLPCLLHASDYGSILIESSVSESCLTAESLRSQRQWNASFAAKPLTHRSDGLFVLPKGVTRWDMTATVESILPLPGLTKTDPRFASLPRCWLNTFQYRPDLGMLANNIVSDNCVFCMHQYADAAVYTQTLPGGIKPIQVVRESLDRYFAGAPGYGVGWEDIEMDTYPSLLIAAWDVIRVTGDKALLRKWMPHLERIAEAMNKQDRNGNGLPESTRTGVAGEARCPTSNWWDQINFGGEDAYGCALAYRGLGCLVDLEKLAGNRAHAAIYQRRANRVKAAYVLTFLNPDTGVLAGWKDSQGKLHDYYFTFVNGIAIAYGLVGDDLANKIVDRIEAKMKEVGYTRFDLGLPGPLVVIPKNDYGPGSLGSPQREDGTDTWQVFEHGGATACFASYYIQALYKLGRRAEADRILWPMMKAYGEGRYQNGVGKGGEWTRWDGTPSGYEGMLADAYSTQTVLFTGYYGIGFGPQGFYLEPWSPLKGKRVPLGLHYSGMR